MPNIRISDDTHKRLVDMKRGNDTVDTVIRRLLDFSKKVEGKLEEFDRERQAVESNRAADRPGSCVDSGSPPGETESGRVN